MDNNKECIAIDVETQGMLRSFNQVIVEAKARIELTLKVYLNAKGIKDGEYQVSPNFDTLLLNKNTNT